MLDSVRIVSVHDASSSGGWRWLRCLVALQFSWVSNTIICSSAQRLLDVRLLHLLLRGRVYGLTVVFLNLPRCSGPSLGYGISFTLSFALCRIWILEWLHMVSRLIWWDSLSHDVDWPVLVAFGRPVSLWWADYMASSAPPKWLISVQLSNAIVILGIVAEGTNYPHHD
jgi:hypothetical protein